MAKKEKTAIICSGGMRSAHGGGLLYALGTKFNIRPDIIVASSGNAGNAIYFCAEQYDDLKNIWLERLSTPKFISFLRLFRIMDIDYLVDEVFKKLNPLNLDRLGSSTVAYFISVTDAKTGKTRYASKNDLYDVFEVLRASAAIPIFYGKKIRLFFGRYVDGEAGPTAEDHISFALAQGATRILFIENGKTMSGFNAFAARIYSKLLPRDRGESLRRDISANAACVESPVAKILCFRPSIKEGALTRSPQKLEKLFNQGISDALSLEKEMRLLFQG